MVTRKKQSSMRGFYAALAVIAIAGVAWIGWQTTRPKPGAQIVDNPSLPPAVAGKAEGYLYGNPDAPVQIVEFADFECPACGTFATLTEPDVRKRLVDTGIASIRFFDFPLPQHLNSIPASMAAACAGDEGKFWQMHDRIFLGQPEWASRPGEGESSAKRKARKAFVSYAKELGLNQDGWAKCYDEQRHLGRIQSNRQLGMTRKIQSTPTFIIGKRVVPGALSYDRLRAYVDSARAEAGQTPATAPLASPPPKSIAPR